MGNRINMGMEKLLSMGGFIQEYAEDKIYESFSPSAANRLEKYCDTGEYIWQIGETIEQALQSIQKYANIRDLYMNEDESIYGSPDKTFMEWLVEQSVRCKKEKLKSMEPSFWIQWDMKRNMKKKMLQLNALEEKVLSYSFGIHQKAKMLPEEIAKLPEFQCDTEYIMLVLEGIDKTLGIDCALDSEFNELCEAMRIKQEENKIAE